MLIRLRIAVALLFLATNLGCQFQGGPAASPATTATRHDRAKLQKALAQAETGDAKAQYELGKILFYGPDDIRDRAEAIKWLQRAADQNEAQAQTALGRVYLQGVVVSRDFPRAVAWLNKADAQGEPDAHAILLGLTLLKFPFITNGCVDPGARLRESADQGKAMAQVCLAQACLQGLGMATNETEGVNWMREAALQGQPAAQAFLARAYFDGHLVATNYATAVRWARRAATVGEARAQETLGRCYSEGKGVHRNPVIAAKWFREAAEQGDNAARLSLGLAYRRGQGVSQDYVQAYHWLDLAAVEGNPNAASARDELFPLMTTEQRAQAGAVARRHLTPFDRHLIDAHHQRYSMSCIPSAVEMVLKLTGRVPGSYYDQQNLWQDKADGSFHNFDGQTIAGLTFHQQFTQAHGDSFPLADLFTAIDRELQAGRFVIIGLPSGGGTHDWVIYDEDSNGEFLAVSKDGPRTLENNHVRKTVIEMKGTDIGTYDPP
jgi:TPR repeat protein